MLSFRWGESGTEGMVGEKIISTSFGGAAGHGERAPGASATQPLCGADQAPHGAWAALPLRGADPSATWHLGGSSTRGRTSATWRLGLGKRLDWLWQPQRHVALGKTRCVIYVINITIFIIINSVNIKNIIICVININIFIIINIINKIINKF